MAKRSRPVARKPRRPDSLSEPADRDLGFYAFRVRDVMTRKAVCVRADDTLEEAARRMVDARVSGLPVLAGGGRLVGVISQKDIVRRLNERAGLSVPHGLFDLLLHERDAAPTEIATAARRALGRGKVRQAMSQPPISARGDTPLEEAIGLLISNGINRLPVVDRGRVVGIVTRTDLLSGVSAAR